MKINPVTSRHIFLAEDDEDDKLLFVEALSEIDKSVVVTYAADGKKLMDILRQDPKPMPDLLFLDLNMPIRNGYECLDEIRSNDSALKNLHVIVLTTSRQKENIEAVYQLGASHYIVKPSSYSGLKSILSKVLKMDWPSAPQRTDRKDFVLA